MPREAFEQRLQDLLDRRLRPEEDEELRALAAAEEECGEECRELLLGQQRLFEGLAACEVPQLPTDFAERAVAVAWDSNPERAARTDLATGSNRRYVRWIAAACAIALLLAAVPLWSYLNPPQQSIVEAPRNSNGQIPGVAPATNANVAANPSTRDEVARDEVIHDSHDRYQDIYQALVELRRQEGLLTTRPQWVDEVALGLKPVATSVEEAFNMLRQNLPPMNDDEEPKDPEKPQAMGGASLDPASIS